MNQWKLTVVATSGANITRQQIAWLRLFEKVTLFPDGDEAGLKATAKAVEQLQTVRCLRVAVCEPGSDPGDLSGMQMRDRPDGAEGVTARRIWSPQTRNKKQKGRSV